MSSDIEQDDKIIDTIYFGSGSGKGYSFLGAVAALEQKGVISLESVKTFGGVSVGALIALMYVLGLTIYQAIVIGVEVDLDWVLNLTEEVTSADWDWVVKMIERKSIFEGERFRTVLEILLDETIGDPQISMKDLYQKTGKTFRVWTTDLATFKCVELSHETHPTMTVVDAVLCSAALPFVFPPVQGMNGEIFVDGALTTSNGIFHGKQEGTLVIYVVTTPSFAREGSFISYVLDIVNCIIHRDVTNKKMGTNQIALKLDSVTNIFPKKGTRDVLVKEGFSQGITWYNGIFT